MPLILSLPEVKVFVSENLEDQPLYSSSSLTTSPIYLTRLSERPSLISPFPANFDFTSLSRDPSPFDYLAEL